MRSDKIRDQLRRNAVALISLAIAVTSLGYNTWRNEHTENNRNQRWASFEILLKLGELEDLIFANHFDCNMTLRGNVRSGWVIVRTVQDLAVVLDEMDLMASQKLFEVWEDQYRDLTYDSEAACRERSEERRKRGYDATDEVKKAIEAVRADALAVLSSLD